MVFRSARGERRGQEEQEGEEDLRSMHEKRMEIE